MENDNVWLLEEARRLTAYINSLPEKQRKALIKQLPQDYRTLDEHTLLKIYNIILESPKKKKVKTSEGFLIFRFA